MGDLLRPVYQPVRADLLQGGPRGRLRVYEEPHQQPHLHRVQVEGGGEGQPFLHVHQKGTAFAGLPGDSLELQKEELYIIFIILRFSEQI